LKIKSGLDADPSSAANADKPPKKPNGG
jgi:hypothetical protein